MTAIHPSQDQLMPVLYMALLSPGLMAPNEFNLARYSLNAQTRNRLLDPDIMALEDFLIDHSGLPDGDANLTLLTNFGDVVHHICTSEETSLQVGYQYMSWLLAWLNIHHLPSFFGEDPDSPLQVLQMAANVGYGEWAAAYNQIDEGLERIFHHAASPLWRVRAVSALGLQRLLRHAWERTLRRLHYQSLIANSAEWCTILNAWGGMHAELLQDQPERQLDTWELCHKVLRFVTNATPEQTASPQYQPLLGLLNSAFAPLVAINPDLGFAQLGVWANWQQPLIKNIVRANLSLLTPWSSQVAWVEGQLANAV